MAKDKSKAEPVEETKTKKNKAEKAASGGKAEKASKGKASDLDDELDDPGSGAGDDWRFNQEALGELVVIKGIKIEEDFKTSAGTSDVVRAKTVVVVNEKKPAKSEVHTDVLIFGTVVVNSLREKVGKTVAARLVKGEASPGKSAPYLLEGADADEKEAALAAIRAVL